MKDIMNPAIINAMLHRIVVNRLIILIITFAIPNLYTFDILLYKRRDDNGQLSANLTS